jgi:NAD(P)-dependent dehydrogenase (short-subunit alcohol dehydrogenase family)
MPDKELKGRVAVVTGGARGIGKSIAAAFAGAGATVVIGDRRTELGADTANELSTFGVVDSRFLDVRDWESVGAFFRSVASDHGSIDISVNNAGVTAIEPALEMTSETWREVVSVNLDGVFACAQAAGQAMVRQRAGSIINLASAAAVLALPGRAPYCATKGAVISLTKVLAVEWVQHGIRVNAIGPGWVRTDFVQDAIDAGKLDVDGISRRTPMRRLAEPAEIAEVALFLASDRSSYVTGQTIFPDGGFTSFGAW